jgi:hypothetical protein
MTQQPGFKAFEKRIEELLEKSRNISPSEMLTLLRRADSSPSVDVEQEVEQLREHPRDTQTE